MIDHRGEYYNADGSFSKERRDDSVGVCIMQNPTECIICGLNEYINVYYDTVLSLLRRFPDWRLGEQEEMHTAVKFYQAQLNIRRSVYYKIRLCVSGGFANNGITAGLFFFYIDDTSSDVHVDCGEKCFMRLFKTVKL